MAQAGSPSPPEDGLDPRGLRDFRLALAREARRFRDYPAQAVDAGWQGTVEIRVSLASGGIAEGVSLAKSSGHVILDEAALAMLGRALMRTPVPATLRGPAFTIAVPVVFELPGSR